MSGRGPGYLLEVRSTAKLGTYFEIRDGWRKLLFIKYSLEF